MPLGRVQEEICLPFRAERCVLYQLSLAKLHIDILSAWEKLVEYRYLLNNDCRTLTTGGI